MMTPKRILFAVLCVLLILVILMTCVIIHKISSLFAGTSQPTNPTQTGTQSSTAGTDPSDPSDPSDASDPTQTEPVTNPTEESSLPTDPSSEHNYELTFSQPATCDGYGFNTYTCTICGKVDTPQEEMTEPLGHIFGYGMVVAPTCTEKGYTLYTCSRCNSSEHRDETERIDHTWDAGTPIEATCTENACTLYTCTAAGCGAAKQENIIEGSALGHDYQPSGDYIPPTVTEEGYQPLACTRCSEESKTNVITAAYLRKTGQDSRILEDETGASYQEYTVYVGTAVSPTLFTYTIRDFINAGNLSFDYDITQGLIVSYTDELGDLQQLLLPMCQDAVLDLTEEALMP